MAVSFCICEKKECLITDECAFLFSYPITDYKEIVMHMCQTRHKPSNAELSLRSYVSNNIQLLFSFLKTLDLMPEKRTLLLKMLNSDDTTINPSVDDNMSARNESDQVLASKGKVVIHSELQEMEKVLECNEQDMTVTDTGTYLAKRKLLLEGAIRYEATGTLINKIEDNKGDEMDEPLELKQNVSMQGGCQGLLYGVMCLLCINPKKKVNISGFDDILSPHIRLYNVYLSKYLRENELYVSIGQLTGDGYDIKVGSNGEVTIHLSENFNHIVGRGSLDKGRRAYELRFFNGSVSQGADDQSREEQEQHEYDAVEGLWVLDSGCPNHITRQQSFLTEQWKMRKGKKLEVAGMGGLNYKIKGNVNIDGMRLKNVCLCQGSRSNLVSVPQLNVLGYNFFFSGNGCFVRYKEADDLVGLANKDGGNSNYYVEFLNSVE
ncbi:hypothetical protein QOZ80_6AG0529820 [Eleusine coracana subsp. coracana]|nr:hypothetical protein QOZ80_6AG0529820 [Eleusine coracana subsp. coracana]